MVKDRRLYEDIFIVLFLIFSILFMIYVVGVILDETTYYDSDSYCITHYNEVLKDISYKQCLDSDGKLYAYKYNDEWVVME